MCWTDAENYEANGEFELAYKKYIEAYRGNNSSIELLEKLGKIALILNNSSDATQWYRKIVSLDSQNINAVEHLVKLSANINKYEYYGTKALLNKIKGKRNSAIKYIKKALKYSKTDKEAWMAKFTLGGWFEDFGKQSEAIKVYLSLLNSTMIHQEVYIRLAKLYLHNKRVKEAINILHLGLNDGFDIPEIRELLSITYFDIGDYKMAGEITDNELFRIKCTTNDMNYSESARLLEELKDKYENEANYYAVLGEYYLHQEDFVKFRECIDKYGELEPKSEIFYEMKMISSIEADDELSFHLNFAKYNLILDNPTAALNNYMKAYNKKDDDLTVIKNIAELSESQGKIKQALKFYNRFVELSPANNEVEFIKEKIKDLKKKNKKNLLRIFGFKIS